MGVRIRDRNRIPEALANIDRINGRSVKIGYISGGEYAGGTLTNKGKARVHEYGVDIPVTDKMRNFWVAKFGVGLKASTTHIRIPERSFLRNGSEQATPAIMAKAKELVPLAILGNVDVELLYEALGLEMRTEIQKYARALQSPPNAPLTVQQKGSSNPLVETGAMLQAMEVILQ